MIAHDYWWTRREVCFGGFQREIRWIWDRRFERWEGQCLLGLPQIYRDQDRGGLEIHHDVHLYPYRRPLEDQKGARVWDLGQG